MSVSFLKNPRFSPFASKMASKRKNVIFHNCPSSSQEPPESTEAPEGENTPLPAFRASCGLSGVPGRALRGRRWSGSFLGVRPGGGGGGSKSGRMGAVNKRSRRKEKSDMTIAPLPPPMFKVRSCARLHPALAGRQMRQRFSAPLPMLLPCDPGGVRFPALRAHSFASSVRSPSVLSVW